MADTPFSLSIKPSFLCDGSKSVTFCFTFYTWQHVYVSKKSFIASLNVNNNIINWWNESEMKRIKDNSAHWMNTFVPYSSGPLRHIHPCLSCLLRGRRWKGEEATEQQTPLHIHACEQTPSTCMEASSYFSWDLPEGHHSLTPAHTSQSAWIALPPLSQLPGAGMCVHRGQRRVQKC